MKKSGSIRYTFKVLVLAGAFLCLSVPAAYGQQVDQVSEGPIAEEAEIPGRYILEPAYPNPFNPSTTIRFGLKEAQPVKLVLHDMLGRQIRVLYEGTPEPGKMQSVTIDGQHLPTGVYVVRLVNKDFVTTQTITLVK